MNQTQTQWRIVRREYYIRPYQEEPGSTTFCDSGPTYDHPLSYFAGNSTESTEDLKRWDAARVGLWKDEIDEQDAGYDDHHYDGSNYYLQTKQDGKWTDVKLIIPVERPPDCTECNDHGCSSCQDPRDFIDDDEYIDDDDREEIEHGVHMGFYNS